MKLVSILMEITGKGIPEVIVMKLSCNLGSQVFGFRPRVMLALIASRD